MAIKLSDERYEEIKLIVVRMFVEYGISCAPINGFEIAHKMGVSELAEKEVNFFAKYALAPPVLIHKLKLDNPESIVQVFEISYEAARYAYHYYKKWLRHGYGESDYTDYERQILHLFDPAS